MTKRQSLAAKRLESHDDFLYPLAAISVFKPEVLLDIARRQPYGRELEALLRKAGVE